MVIIDDNTVKYVGKYNNEEIKVVVSNQMNQSTVTYLLPQNKNVKYVVDKDKKRWRII